MNAPKTTDKMIKSLSLEAWRKDNQEVCEEFGISGNVVCRSVSFDIIEALVHDALEYRKVCE